MKVYEWSKDWNLPLDESKCAFLTTGSSPATPYSLFDGGPELQQLQSVQDIGIVLECSLKHSVNCIAAVKKVRAAVFLVKRSLLNLTPAVLFLFYCTLVRPQLEYAIQATSTYLKKDIYHTQRFQRFATRMVKGLHHLPYIQRLQRFNLCSLEKRRRRADLILVHGIFHGRYDLPHDLFVTLPSCTHLRGHDLKLRHRSFNLARKKVAVVVRIVEPWNK